MSENQSREPDREAKNHVIFARVTERLHNEARYEAARRKMSLNELVGLAIEAALRKRGDE